MDELIAQAPEIIAVIGGITALFVAWSNINKNRATAKKTVVDAAAAAVNNLIDPLNERIDQLAKALEDLTFEHYRFYMLVVILTDQLEESGIQPLVRLEELAAWDNQDLAAIAKEREIKLPRAVRRYSR
jgi:hypothetical protein